VTDLDPRFDSAIDIAAPPSVKKDSLDNENFPWDSFDSDAYFEHNYGKLRVDDEQIIDIVADFFQRTETPRKLRPGHRRRRRRQPLPGPDHAALRRGGPSLERAFTNREWLASEILKQPAPLVVAVLGAHQGRPAVL
jgi:hypothetical protein